MDPSHPFQAQELSLLEKLEQRIGYQFKDKGLLLSSLTHASGARAPAGLQRAPGVSGRRHSRGRGLRNSLSAVPGISGGRTDATQVDRRQPADLRKISEALGMQEFLILGKGMATHPSVPSSLLADVFESLLGGDVSRRRRSGAPGSSSSRTMGPEIELAAEGETGSNYKSLLQQLAQREHGTTPDLPIAGRKGARSQQVLQNRGPDRRPAISSRPGDATRRKPSSARPAMP